MVAFIFASILQNFSPVYPEMLLGDRTGFERIFYVPVTTNNIHGIDIYTTQYSYINYSSVACGFGIKNLTINSGLRYAGNGIYNEIEGVLNLSYISMQKGIGCSFKLQRISVETNNFYMPSMSVGTWAKIYKKWEAELGINNISSLNINTVDKLIIQPYFSLGFLPSKSYNMLLLFERTEFSEINTKFAILYKPFKNILLSFGIESNPLNIGWGLDINYKLLDIYYHLKTNEVGFMNGLGVRFLFNGGNK